MKQLLFITFFTLLLPITAQAEFSYSWFEVGYIADVGMESTGGTENGDGADARINFLAGDHLYITGHIDEIELEDKLDVDRFGLGFGLHFEPIEAVGVFATLTYEDFESPLQDDKGTGVTVGVRYQWEEDFEFYGNYNQASYDEMKGKFLSLGTVWAFTQNYAFVAEYSTGEFEFETAGNSTDRDDLRVALRVQF